MAGSPAIGARISWRYRIAGILIQSGTVAIISAILLAAVSLFRPANDHHTPGNVFGGMVAIALAITIAGIIPAATGDFARHRRGYSLGSCASTAGLCHAVFWSLMIAGLLFFMRKFDPLVVTIRGIAILFALFGIAGSVGGLASYFYLRNKLVLPTAEIIDAF
jgi:hypothetical protein